MNRRVCSVAAVSVLVAGCGSATTPTPAASPITAKAATAPTLSAARTLPSCGTVTGSTGAQRGLLDVRIGGPAHLVTGQVFHTTVTVFLRPHTGHTSVTLMTGGPVLPVIAQGTRIVGAYEGGVAGVGLFGTITARHPYRFVGEFGAASILLRGCPPNPVDSMHPDRGRKLLPPGRYTLYVWIEDDIGRNGHLRSDPFTLTVEPRPSR